MAKQVSFYLIYVFCSLWNKDRPIHFCSFYTNSYKVNLINTFCNCNQKSLHWHIYFISFANPKYYDYQKLCDISILTERLVRVLHAY